MSSSSFPSFYFQLVYGYFENIIFHLLCALKVSPLSLFFISRLTLCGKNINKVLFGSTLFFDATDFVKEDDVSNKFRLLEAASSSKVLADKFLHIVLFVVTAVLTTIVFTDIFISGCLFALFFNLLVFSGFTYYWFWLRNFIIRWNTGYNSCVNLLVINIWNRVSDPIKAI